MDKLLQPHAWTYLRSDKQLGYLVAAQVDYESALPGIIFLIQGIDHSPHEMNQEIEIFLTKFEEILDDMPDKDF